MIDLDKLDALRAAATPGEIAIDQYGNLTIAIRHKVNFTGVSLPLVGGPAMDQATANAEEYAALHNAYPALSKELREQRKLADQYKTIYTGTQGLFDDLAEAIETLAGGEYDHPIQAVEELRAARDHLFADNDRLRRALENLACYAARISPPPYGHACMWCGECVQRVTDEARAAIDKERAK